MIDQHLIDRKIERIRLHKMFGKIIFTIIILTILALTFINLNADLSNGNGQAEQIPNEPIKVSVIEEKEVNTISSSQFTEQERDLVCRVVSAESRGEDLQSQMAVAQVILDRSQLWGMTPTEVVTAPNQFAKPYKGEISDKTYLAVSNIFDGKIRVFEGNTTHFHDDSVQPYWTDNKINRGNIGRMSFYGN